MRTWGLWWHLGPGGEGWRGVLCGESSVGTNLGVAVVALL